MLFRVTWIAPCGQVRSHMPQKEHLSMSMSSLGFCVFPCGVLGCFCVVMASLGHARVQIWQPTHLFLSRVSL